MVNEPAADEAVRIARRCPALRVGLHLTLCDGRASRVSAITDSAGNFQRSPARAGLCYAFDASAAEPLASEIRGQFERFRALGFPSTYWDGHTHLHLHPTILRLTLPIAREHGFRFVRLVREPGPPALIPWIFQALSAAAIPKLRAVGIDFADRVYGLRRTGRISLAFIEQVLAQLPPGVSELYFHPGAEPDLPSSEALAEALKRHVVAAPK